MQKHITRMTLREKCAQMVFADFRFEEPDFERAVELAKKEGVGGFGLFGGSIFDVTPFVNSLQRVAKFPLLIASDFEDGVGQQVSGATVFPSNMAVGASGSEDLAHLKGRHTGLEARVLGVPWVLAPVVDVNANPDNPVINTRSFGADPAEGARLARAYVRGLHAAGALACAKHFPGHGDAAVDSHLELPVDERPLDRLRETELRPYAELASELDAVMTGHLLVKAVDPGAPASLSREVTEGLLRRDLRFDGVVCTDALVMGGVTRFCPEREAVERAAAAGADVLLFPKEPGPAIGFLEEAVKEGRLAESSVDRSVERIFTLKDRLGLFRERISDMSGVERLVMGNPAHRAGAQRIAEAAVTLVRGEGRVEGKAAYVRVGGEGSRADLSVFERELAEKVELSEGAERCVVGVFFRPRAWGGKAALDASAVERVREAQRKYRDVLVVSFGSPYVLRQFPDVGGYVCAWGEDEFSQRAAARALLGAIPFKGKPPVPLA